MNCYLVQYTHPNSSKEIYFKVYTQSTEDCYRLLLQYLDRDDLSRHDLVVRVLIEDEILSKHECVKEVLKLIFNNFKETPTQLFLDVINAEKLRVDEPRNEVVVKLCEQKIIKAI